MVWPAMVFTGLAKCADISSDAAAPIVRDAFQRQEWLAAAMGGLWRRLPRATSTLGVAILLALLLCR